MAAWTVDVPDPEGDLAAAVPAVLAVRDRELESLRARLDEAQQNALALDQGREELFAVIRRVRTAVHVADDRDVTDWQRGYQACSERALAALDQPAGAEERP
ncbi:hypothetical protein [Streptomyces sp. NPDC058086]|uniref:hypothetical protein n=1 Tax=Streptomyces sp. NPDC058086 TaxID=3346334 RepID=UPI0036E31DF0